MLLRMLLILVQEYLFSKLSAILDVPARLFLSYQAMLALCFLMIINTGMVFSPICKISHLENSSFCAFVNDARSFSAPSSLPYASFFNAHSEVLGGAMEGTSVAESSSLDFTQAHIAVDDLILSVRHSDIVRKSDLTASLDLLRSETRLAGYHLQAFASSFAGSVERCAK